jgi:cation transport regulator
VAKASSNRSTRAQEPEWLRERFNAQAGRQRSETRCRIGATKELPDSVKNSLPSHAQDIYREAFDSAWDEYQDPAKRRGYESLEEVAHKVAWAAVKKKYQKVGEEWQPKD